MGRMPSYLCVILLAGCALNIQGTLPPFDGGDGADRAEAVADTDARDGTERPDAGDAPGDCDGCDRPCARAEDCPGDGNACNGQEHCNFDTGRCERRSVPATGTACGVSPRRICVMQECRESECGDAYVDVEAGEACEGADSQACETACGSEGTQGCTLTCSWGACITPMESCNGEDDDCNGETDEDFTCRIGTEGSCTTACGSTGRTLCDATCAWGPCEPPPEVPCNGVDDDCDGTCDQGCCLGQTLPDPCVTCDGAGRGYGNRACVMGASSAAPCVIGFCCSLGETCGDGCDNDCNGLADEEGYPGAESVLRVTENAGASVHPSLVYNAAAGQFGLAWADETPGNYELFFAAFSAAGARVATNVQLTSALRASVRPSLVAAGSGYAVAWVDFVASDTNPDIHLGTMGGDGSGFLGSSLVTDNAFSHHPSLAFVDGTTVEYVVAYQDPRFGGSDILATAAGATGTRVGADQRVTGEWTNAMRPDLAFTGTMLGVAWDAGTDGAREIWFRAFPVAASVTGDPKRVTNAPGDSRFAAVAYASGRSEFGVAWIDNRNGRPQLFFAALRSDGDRIGPDIFVDEAAEVDLGGRDVVSIVWNGGVYGLAWTDDRSGNPEIYATGIDTRGTKLVPVERITFSGGESSHPSYAFGGGKWAVAWQDDRDGNYEIYFTILGCKAPELH